MIEHRIAVDEFASLEAIDEHNVVVKLSTLWQQKPTVLIFVRHFG